MRIILFGSGDFGLPVFERLIERGEELTLVTIPPRRAGRGLKMSVNPLAGCAEQKKVRTFFQDDIRNPVFIGQLKKLSPELIIVMDYGKIVPAGIIALPSVGGTNIHPSLLPKYRGASPIQSCLMRSERETGVTVQILSPRIDAGDILALSRTPIGEDDDYPSLAARLKAMSVPLIEHVIDDWGSLKPLRQNESEATYCRKFGKEAYTTDWKEPAEDIRNRMRAFYPAGLRTVFRDMIVKLLKAEAVADKPEWSMPLGAVCEKGAESMVIKTGTGGLRILEVQPENRIRMQVKDFMNGYRPETGEVFRSFSC
jgi:methionyl-tRNA formyltransferase